MSYRAIPKRSGADDCLWVVLALVVMFYTWKLLKDQLADQLAGGEEMVEEPAALSMAQAAAASVATQAGGAVRRSLGAKVASSLAAAKVGDTISAEMLAEIAQLMALRQ